MPVRLTQLRAQRGIAGRTIPSLAAASNTSDKLIAALESPHPITDGSTSGTCNEVEAQRIADVLGVSLATLGVARL
jgi:hypothetical protein